MVHWVLSVVTSLFCASLPEMIKTVSTGDSLCQVSAALYSSIRAAGRTKLPRHLHPQRNGTRGKVRKKHVCTLKRLIFRRIGVVLHVRLFIRRQVCGTLLFPWAFFHILSSCRSMNRYHKTVMY